MKQRFARVLLAALLLVGVAALAACGGKGGSSSGGGGGTKSAGGFKMGPGVTAKTITLGVQTDLSGPFAPLGEAVTQGNQLYWKLQNQAGGVCGRQVQLIVKDHGYDPQTAVTQYRDMAPKVAALLQVIGSPISAAELPSWNTDHMLALLAAWAPSLLNQEPVGILGATYDLEAVNGIDWLMANKGLKKGDAIGDLYFEGDYGEGALQGVQYMAKKYGLKVVEQKIKATDTDMTAAASAFKQAGVKAIWVTTGPKQLASIVGTAAAVGLDVPVGGNGPTFSPLLLATPVGKLLEKNFTLFGAAAPFSLDTPNVKAAADAYVKAYPKGVPQASVLAGWTEGTVMKATLEKACASKDLSRERIEKSFHELSNFDTGGLVAAPLDFTKLGEPAGKSVYVTQPDTKTRGGQRVVGDGTPYLSPTAETYTVAIS